MSLAQTRPNQRGTCCGSCGLTSEAGIVESHRHGVDLWFDIDELSAIGFEDVPEQNPSLERHHSLLPPVTGDGPDGQHIAVALPGLPSDIDGLDSHFEEEMDFCSARSEPYAESEPSTKRFRPAIDYRMVHVVLTEGRDCRLWSPREETFLVGIIFDMFYRRGSLAPTRLERDANDPCWSQIKRTFDQATKRYCILSNKTFDGQPLTCSTRTKKAIVRHFKVMKGIASEQDANLEDDGNDMPLFKKHHLDWMNEYNKDSILTVSEEKFLLMIQ